MLGWAPVVNAPVTKFAVAKLPKFALVATKLPVAASSVILPVVIPFLTTKFFVVILKSFNFYQSGT
jgi:hypothetical protein